MQTHDLLERELTESQKLVTAISRDCNATAKERNDLRDELAAANAQIADLQTDFEVTTRTVAALKKAKARIAELEKSLSGLMNLIREDSGSSDPMEPFAYDARWEECAREADRLLIAAPPGSFPPDKKPDARDSGPVVAATSSNNESGETHAHPVAESQAPAPEAGDAGVAPGLGGRVPDTATLTDEQEAVIREIADRYAAPSKSNGPFYQPRLATHLDVRNAIRTALRDPRLVPQSTGECICDKCGIRHGGRLPDVGEPQF